MTISRIVALMAAGILASGATISFPAYSSQSDEEACSEAVQCMVELVVAAHDQHLMNKVEVSMVLQQMKHFESMIKNASNRQERETVYNICAVEFSKGIRIWANGLDPTFPPVPTGVLCVSAY